MGEIFLNNDHLWTWMERAEEIRVSRGTSQALDYLIGEKFFNLASLYFSFRDEITVTDPEKNLPLHGYEPAGGGHWRHLNRSRENTIRASREMQEMLAEFASIINRSFEPYMIRSYFSPLHSNTTSEIAHCCIACGNPASETPEILEEIMQYLAVG